MEAGTNELKSSTANDALPTTGSKTIHNPNSSTAPDTIISTHQLSGALHPLDASISHIAILPPELHLRLLSELSARDIQKCRRLDRYFQSLIDNEQNNSLCTGPGVAQSLARLEEQTALLSDFPMDTTSENGTPTAFLSAFIRFIRYHGLAPFEETGALYCKIVGTFAVDWFNRRREVDEPQAGLFTEDKRSALGHFVTFAMLLVRSHMELHVPGSGPSNRQFPVATAMLEEVADEQNLSIAGMTAEDHKGLLLRLMYHKDGLFHGAQFHQEYAAPEHTGHSLLYQAHEDPLLSRLKTMLALSQLLGVPLLRWSTPACWFVSSQWAFDELKRRLLLEENEGPINHVKKAALLEDMFLHFDPDIGKLSTRDVEES
ncbi:hypothetical protein HII31_04226 [Pseudocercospora fuligena]|uniref:F-box domain-containing protein n=1 Tax=Pseudocercospora fuligena TaxID=685502 RepID=A0A8H6RQI7_9PEZI|nr:hypothetical protein HII31_04226 [Pseudocercospora fuligena]